MKATPDSFGHSQITLIGMSPIIEGVNGIVKEKCCGAMTPSGLVETYDG